MQNADKSSSGRTRLLKGTVAVARNSQDILAPPTPYSYKGAGSRVLVAIGGSTECCTSANTNTNIQTPIIARVEPGDGYLDVYFEPTRSLTYWTVSTSSSVLGENVPDVSGDAPPIRVNNLVNRRAYTLRLAKTTPEGSSSESAPFMNAVPIPVPSAPSLAIVAGNQTLTVTVTAPASIGGSAIICYEKSFNNLSWVPVVFSSGMTFAESGLTNGVSRTVYVRAVNSDGPGPAASAVGIPATVPELPTVSIIPGAQSLTVTVTAGGDGGSPIRTLALTYVVSGMTISQTLTYNQVPVTYTIPSLVNGTLYTVSATAVNDIGTSNVATATGTPATTPGIPGLTVAVGNHFLTVTVTPPASNGAAITAYQRSLDNSSWIPADLSGSNTFTVTGLENDVASTVYVRAVNSMGTGGAASIIGTPTAAPQIPLAPVLTVVTSKTNTTITVAFTQEPNGIIITNYKYSLNGGAFTALTTPDTTTPVTISGLNQATTYEIKLKAVSAGGDSAESNSITDVTYTLRVDDFTSSGIWTAPAGVTAVQYLIVGGGGGGGGTYSDIDILGDVPVATSKPSTSTYWINKSNSNYLYNNYSPYSNNTRPYRLTVKDTAGTTVFPLSIGGGGYWYNKWYKDTELVYTGTSLGTVTNAVAGGADTLKSNNISGGGGGGAGGEVKQLSGTTTYAVTPGASYAVIVGAGGAGGTASVSPTKTEADGTVGSSSSFDGVTALGGSGGGKSRGSRPSNGYQTGGKGGFGFGDLVSGQGGSGLSSNAFGQYINSNYGKYNTADAGIQGRYIDFDVNGSSEIYAAGGPGGIPNIESVVNATANSGNGGSGTGATLNSAANGRTGGSGIVKIKYYI